MAVAREPEPEPTTDGRSGRSAGVARSPVPAVAARATSGRATGDLASLVVAAVLCACGAEPPAEHTPNDAPWSYDLVARLDEALVSADVGRLDLADPAARDVLRGGWAFPRADDPGGLWTDAAESRVALFVARPVERDLVIRARTAHEGVRVAARWNDTDLGALPVTTTASAHALRVPFPAQRTGENLVTLVTTVDGEPPGAGRRPWDDRLFVESLESVPTDPADAALLGRTRAAVPGGAAVTDPGRSALVQAWSARILHAVRPPADARLVGRTGTAGSGAGVRHRVHLATDGAGGRVLWEGGAGESFDVPLDVSGGTPVALELSVRSTGATPAGVWERLELRAPEADVPPLEDTARRAAAPDADDRLAELRAACAGAPVVVVLLDTLAPRFLGAYGGDPALAPHLDRLAAEGVRFADATAQASHTIPSIAALLTGAPTRVHATWEWTRRLPGDARTLAERFAAGGWRTAGVTKSPNGSSRFGFDRGFDTWIDDWKPRRPADSVFPHVESLLASDDGRPLFLWLHLLEPHEPYHPPAPFRGAHDPTYDGAYTGDPAILWDIRRHERHPTPRDVEHLRAEYADNVAWIDSVFGGLRERLEAAGVWDRAVVAVTADHGEGFLEHDGKVHAGMGHGSTVYDEMVRVPWLLKLPDDRLAGTVVEAPVAGFDLLPTIADLVGVTDAGSDRDTRAAGDREPASRGGADLARSVAARLVGAAAADDRLIVTHSQSHADGGLAPTWGVRHGRWKLVVTPGDPPELYDLDADPGERHDVASEHPVLAGWLHQRLRATGALDVAAPADDAPMEVDPDTLEDLRALGYLMGESDER